MADGQFDRQTVRRFEFLILQPEYRRPALDRVWQTAAEDYELMTEIGLPGEQGALGGVSGSPYHFQVFRRRR
jgi:hypothetical protein